MTPIKSFDYVNFSNIHVNDHLSLSHFEMLIHNSKIPPPVKTVATQSRVECPSFLFFEELKLINKKYLFELIKSEQILVNCILDKDFLE